jgi:CheY-like chemotaxis protein
VSRDARPARVIVVDDDELVRGLIEDTLSATGTEVRGSGGGQEALALLAEGAWRSEERRVGKECRRLGRSRWSPYH